MYILTIEESKFNELKNSEIITYEDIENIRYNTENKYLIEEHTIIFNKVSDFLLVVFEKNISINKRAYYWCDNKLIGLINNKIMVYHFYYGTVDHRSKLYNIDNLSISRSHLCSSETGGNTVYIITLENIPLLEELSTLKFEESAI